MSTTKKVSFSVLLVLFTVIGASIYYFMSTVNLELKHKNISELYLVEKQEYEKNRDTKKVKKITLSQTEVRLKKAQYVAVYTGSPGYANGTMGINLDSTDKKLEINPTYSEEKLNSILDSETTNITSVIKAGVFNIDQYLIQKGKLYDFGEWYATTLLYNGADEFNADTLKIVLKKDVNTWKIITNPPQIILSKHLYKEVPDHILDDINNNQKPKIQFKYTGEE